MDKCGRTRIVIDNVITKDKDVAEPIIVKFSNGTLATQNVEGALFKSNQSKSSDSRLAFKGQQQRIMCVKTDNLVYAGKNFGKDKGSSYVKEQNFIALLDRNTNRMKLIECSSFLLHPITKDVSVAEVDEKLDKPTLNIVELGGKFAKRNHQKKLARQIDVNEMAGPLLMGLEENVKPLEEIKMKDDLEGVLPPCNKLAFEANKVYSLESIVSDDVLLLLYDEVTQHQEEIEKATWLSPQMKFNTLSIRFITDEDENGRFMCASLYTEYLIQLLTVPLKSLNKNKYMLKDCQNMVEEEIHKQYTAGKFPRRSRSKKDEDRLACHIIVLVLLINGLQFQLQTMVQSLRFKKDRFLTLCRCIGATYDKKTGYIVLKLPLVEIKISNKIDRKRKRK